MIGFKELGHNLKKYFRLVKAIYKDKRTPRISKVFLWMAIVYFLSPIDLIPDFIPVIGALDDLIIVPGLVMIALRFVPEQVYRENYDKAFKKK